MAVTTDYVPESSLGWLDFDSAASERVGELLRALDEPGTLDVLGLGTVRDAFSGMLNPGTSTIQTRLRYFLFVPWICVRLEAQRVPPGEFSRRLRDDEARLIDCLRHLGRNEGVIGYTAGRNLKRMPSDAYWGGLWTWGLRRMDLSISEYGQRAAAIGRHQPDRDDDKNAMTRAVSMWADLPPAPDDFLHAEITFDLTPDEAQLLIDHIRRRHVGTLLAVLCATPRAAAQVDYPWELPAHGMPSQLVEILRHARNFSELTAGPQHLYNVLVARQARAELSWDTNELESRELARLDDWTDRIAARLDDVRSWVNDLPEFWALLNEFGINLGVQEFVNAMVERIADDPEGFAEDSAVHRRIRDRELRLKSKRARLAHRSALENWNGEGVGGQFDFRWGITQSYMRDIAAALEARS
ncbi:MAG: hypothetical protein F4091_06995 [Acidimicrobiales bacterium]|nr:hypothetical protein [Acidimicrobiales bacterium]MYF08304.1 hypothetical protein [Rhodospirillaceae bacterium]MYJ65194.1 hypothetical protein [Acidimicrobiales bacterium]